MLALPAPRMHLFFLIQLIWSPQPSSHLFSNCFLDHQINASTVPTMAGRSVTPNSSPMDPNDLPEMPLRPDGSPDLTVLGRSASTADGRKNALKFFNTYQALKGRVPFEELKEEDIAGELLVECFYEFAHFAANTPIPTRCGPGFAPPEGNQNTMIKAPSCCST